MGAPFATERSVLSSMVDTTLLHEPGTECVVKLQDTASLAAHLQALHEVFVSKGLENRAPEATVALTVNKFVRHENDHARAAQLVGGTGIHFGLHVQGQVGKGNNPPNFWAATYWTPRQSYTRTQLAAVALYPLYPSEGDFLDMRAYGFPNMKTAIAAIIQNNELNPHEPLPLPRSHSSNIAHGFDEYEG